jgi:hypothetical protein
MNGYCFYGATSDVDWENFVRLPGFINKNFVDCLFQEEFDLG